MRGCTCSIAFQPCCPRGVRVRDNTTLGRAPSGQEALKLRLQRRLAGKRVTFVGDSVMRQFYEALACFIGLDSHAPIYKDATRDPVPAALREALKAGATVDKIRVMWPRPPGPPGKKGPSAHGYSHVKIDDAELASALVPSSFELWHVDRIGGKVGMARSFPQPNLGLLGSAISSHGSSVASSSATQSTAGTNMSSLPQRLFEGNALLRHLATRADLVISTAGVHYGSDYPPCSPRDGTLHCDTHFVRDLWGLARACSPSRGILTRHGARCVLLEVPPQHFLTAPRGAADSNTTGLWQGGAIGAANAKQYGCGPIDVHMRHSAWRVYNEQVRLAARSSGVPVARLWHQLSDLWQMRPGTDGHHSDCTHWCSDDAVWIRWHAALDEALDMEGGGVP